MADSAIETPEQEEAATPVDHLDRVANLALAAWNREWNENTPLSEAKRLDDLCARLSAYTRAWDQTAFGPAEERKDDRSYAYDPKQISDRAIRLARDGLVDRAQAASDFLAMPDNLRDYRGTMRVAGEDLKAVVEFQAEFMNPVENRAAIAQLAAEAQSTEQQDRTASVLVQACAAQGALLTPQGEEWVLRDPGQGREAPARAAGLALPSPAEAQQREPGLPKEIAAAKDVVAAQAAGDAAAEVRTAVGQAWDRAAMEAAVARAWERAEMEGAVDRAWQKAEGEQPEAAADPQRAAAGLRLSGIDGGPREGGFTFRVGIQPGQPLSSLGLAGERRAQAEQVAEALPAAEPSLSQRIALKARAAWDVARQAATTTVERSSALVRQWTERVSEITGRKGTELDEVRQRVDRGYEAAAATQDAQEPKPAAGAQKADPDLAHVQKRVEVSYNRAGVDTTDRAGRPKPTLQALERHLRAEGIEIELGATGIGFRDLKSEKSYPAPEVLVQPERLEHLRTLLSTRMAGQERSQQRHRGRDR